MAHNELPQWRPSENHLLALSVAQDGHYDFTHEELGQPCGITRQAVDKWFKDKDFLAWWDAEARAWAQRQLPRVIGNITDASTRRFAGGKDPDPKPDAATVKLYLELCVPEYKPATKTEHSGQVDVQHGIAPEVMQRITSLRAEFGTTDSTTITQS